MGAENRENPKTHHPGNQQPEKSQFPLLQQAQPCHGDLFGNNDGET